MGKNFGGGRKWFYLHSFFEPVIDDVSMAGNSDGSGSTGVARIDQMIDRLRLLNPMAW